MSGLGDRPAFPVECDIPDEFKATATKAFYSGVSTRAWLIGQALSGKASVDLQSYPDITAVVRSAIALADCALAEMEKKA